MGYNDQISKLKEGLSGYSEDEERLSELYKNAIANAEAEYENSAKELEKQYYRDRNTVYADTAREEKNLYNILADRGLGFSGEAAQAKLNSNIILSNRLGELSRGNNSQKVQLKADLANRRNELEMDQADKIRDIRNNKNKLDADIAGLLLDKEMNDDKLRAEKEMQAAQIQAEKDMLQAELEAKYNNGSASGSTSSGNTSDKVETPDADISLEENGNGGYIPSISAKDLAKQIVSTATDGGKTVEGDYAEYVVNKYILELTEKYGVDSAYMDELMFMLRSLGYVDVSDNGRRIDVITYDAEAYYDRMYDKYYDTYIGKGAGEEAARIEARKTASKKQVEYVFENSKTPMEFRKCCLELGISESTITEYLKKMESANSGFNGSGAGSYPTENTR